MSLTSVAEVKLVLEVPPALTDQSIEAFIADADLIVTESLGGKGLSSARLATIEKYIACHLIVQLSERGGLTSSQNGESKDTYTPLSAMGNAKINGFALTRYGQQAMILDTTGTLKEMSNPMKKAQFRVIGDAESNGLPI